MAGRRRYDAFISYSRNDEALVKPLVQVLSLAKRRVFWDEFIEPGQKWNEEIQVALASSDAIVIMWCCDSAASEWVRREIRIALRREKRLTPIRLCKYPLSVDIRDFQAINLSEHICHKCNDKDHFDYAGQIAGAMHGAGQPFDWGFLSSPRFYIFLLYIAIFVLGGRCLLSADKFSRVIGLVIGFGLGIHVLFAVKRRLRIADTISLIESGMRSG